MDLIRSLLFIVFYGIASVNGQTGNSFDLFVGTYTNASKSNGIHVYRFNTVTGGLEARSVVTGIVNPSYLAVSKDKKYVYAVSEVGRGQAKAYSYAFDSKSGDLAALSSSPAGGDGPCYISVDPKGKYIFTGMYNSGSLAAIPVLSEGHLGSDSQVIKYEGSSINKQNQSRPHVHAAILSPDRKYLLATDLGTDKIHIYRYNSNHKSPLTASVQASIAVVPGSGPRHLVFHPNGKYVYVVMELTAEVALMEYHNGKLKVIEYVTMLSDEFKGEVEAADIHVSPDGKFLYASNRADGNDLVIYSVGRGGKLTYVGRQKEHVKTPRGFVIDPSGKFLLLANMDGNNVVVFKRDESTGLLNFTGIEAKVDKPVCLKFAY
jgi:6-phosphogluconolactonase